jgi:hypothetical protein
MMTSPRLVLALTLVNLVLLVVSLLSRIESASADNVAPTLRGRALQIVDDQGRVRASIQIAPPTTFQPTGKHYPESVILRLVDANGRPEVKIASSEEGAGLSFVGDSDATQVQLFAEGSESSLKLTNRDGKQQVVKP